MKKKILNAYEKYFYVLVPLVFLTVTSVNLTLYFNSESIFFKKIFLILDSIYMHSYIIYGIILLLSCFYIFYRGNIRNKIMMLLPLFLSLITYSNSIRIKEVTIRSLELDHLILFPLFIIMLNIFEIMIKRKGFKFFEEQMLKIIKITIIYIGVVFALGVISKSYFVSYKYAPYGFVGWMRIPNALSHIYAMILPILMYFFYKQKSYKLIPYILLAISCALVIGTKAAYFSVHISLLLFLLVAGISYVRKKDIDIKKIIFAGVISLFLLSINDYLYTPHLMEYGVGLYTNSSDELDAGKYIINGRFERVIDYWKVYKESGFISKTFGLGVYYPATNYLFTEMDMYDLLFKQGITGLLLYSYSVIYYLYLIVKKIIEDRKKIDYKKLTFLLVSLGLGTLVSVISGHVIFSYVGMITYALVIMFLYSYLYKEKRK